LRLLPIRVKIGQVFESFHSVGIDRTAIFSDAPQQSLASAAKGPGAPTGVLIPGIALPPLEYPLMWIIDDPPSLIELHYERI